MTTVIKTIHDVLAASGYSESFIRIATAQAAHETAFFTSRVFFENNNLFGMKVPRLRETKALYTKNGHAVFESVEDSVKDYILYLKKQNISPNSLNPDQFVTLLAQKGYFEAPLEEYLTGVNHFIKKIYG